MRTGRKSRARFDEMGKYVARRVLLFGSAIEVGWFKRKEAIWSGGENLNGFMLWSEKVMLGLVAQGKTKSSQLQIAGRTRTGSNNIDVENGVTDMKTYSLIWGVINVH